MATVSRAEVKDMYSWWWDSHISPKNSKWLQENLTEMDSNIRTMIKLIEVDEDSFAKRAEMYYKKRPELMKLVEEFYRAYRALAERYYHARGVICQAHRKMAEVFPNEVPLVITDDGPVNPSHDCDPCTPEMQPLVRASFDSDELQEATGLSSTDFLSGKANGEFTNQANLLAGRKGSKHLNGFGKARKGLNFHEVHDGEECMKKNEKDNAQTQVLSESERLGRSETDILALKEALAKLEIEKEAGLLQYQQTLGRLSKLEAEVSRAKQDSEGLSQRASKAEAEVQSLKETLAKVEAEKDASLFQYRQCLDRISNMEAHISRAQQNVGQLHERAFKAEKETELLKEELARLKTEKDALLSKYLEALEKIANLENKLLLAEDYASRTSDRADRAEKEVETLKETVTRLTEEKEAAVLKCEQCLEKIVVLEHEIALIQERTDRLKVEVQDGVAKLKGAEEQCLLLEGTNKSLQSEIASLVEKVGIQNQELSEKQKEMGRLWACVQEERMRFMETENAFQSLQNLHSKVQEELRSVVAELQKKVRLLNEMEIQNQHLVDEVQNVKTENKGLHDLNLSSAVSMKNMQEEILQLKDGKGKLEGELELQLDQRNALQQEVYSLKAELNFLSQKHQDVLVQMESVGLNPESFGSSVKELKDENLKLKDSCQRSNVEIVALVEKLVVMEKLIHKIELLEKSLSDLRAELGCAREKVKELEESYELLSGEKSALADEKTTLLSQLQITTENLEVVSESNSFLEVSLSDANAELEMLRAKSKKLEDSCRLLNDQNTVLVGEKQTLASKTESTERSLEDLGKKHVELEKRYLGLQGERETLRQRVEELRVCLDIEKQEHANSRHFSQMQMAELEDHIRAVQEVGDHIREQFEEELDRAINAQFEIFILQKSIQDLKVQNTSLLGYCEKLVEASLLSEKLVSELERTSNEQEEEVLVLSSQIKGVRTGKFQMLKALETDTSLSTDGIEDEDQRINHNVLGRLRNVKGSLSQVLDENQELVIQKSVLVAVLGQVKRDVGDLNAVIISLREEISDKNEQLVVLQKEMQKLLENNEELILKVNESNRREVVLLSDMEILCGKLFTLQGAYKDLQEEKSGFIKDKESLMKAFEDLEEEKHNLEYECSCMVGEAVALDNLSVIFKNVLSEKSRLITEVRENIDKVCSDNAILVERMRTVEAKLEEVQAKNINLEVLLKKSENEVEEARVLNNQLKDEIANTQDLLFLKEMKLLETEAIKVHQENKILELSDNYAQQLEECKGLYNVIHHLDSQVLEMQKQNEKAEARVGVLSSELQKGKDEAKLWETVAGAFFTELQSCSVREALIREKFSELRKAYEILEEENCSKGVDIVQLRERVGVLEDENCEMKARLAADSSAISSLKESVASLEKHTIWHAKLLRNDNKEKEGTEGCQNLCEDKVTVAELGGLDLQNLQARIQAVEKSVIELKQRAHEEYSTLCSDLDSATRQIEVLKSQNSLRRASGRFSRRFPSHQQEDSKNGSTSGDKPLKMSPNASEPGDELRMKDIMLDQVSDCSSSGKFQRIIGSDDQVLELWQTMDQEASIDLTVGKYRSAAVVPNKHSHLESVKENKSGRPSSESMIEKELGVDEQDSSKRFLNAHQEDTKRKTLERLASDVQKLTNIQITVQDLKEKLEMTENSSKGKGFQCDGIKDQLGETEETILKLFDYSAKLMKKIEKSSPSSFDAPSTADSSDGGGARRRKCSEQARRISEKIGRLQLEVQKIQFYLMKLDNNKAPKAGTRITERNTRILLKDYLYGVSRTPRRRKRTHFCGCVQPPTKGD